jgi:putative transferase (TIGR04331 family)
MYPRLKYVISEDQYQQDALPRAVGALNGIEMITLPHFFPLEIFSSVRLYRFRLPERFIARGAAQSSSLLIGSGTIFPYRLASTFVNKVIDTLYVTTDFYAYFQPLQQSADGCGYDVFKQFRQFVETFIAKLPKSALENISLKKRPPALLNSIQLDYPTAMKVLDPSLPAKIYMAKSKLVVVEGMSTSMFESLASDIPTIAFWPAKLYQLDPACDDYFSELESAGIVLHDPCLLAQQLLMVQSDPESWWRSPSIQAARENFLKLNLHSHRDFQRILLALAGGAIATPR